MHAVALPFGDRHDAPAVLDLTRAESLTARLGRRLILGRWPPIIWLSISIGSLFVLMGAGGDWKPGALFPGLAAVVIGFGAAMYLAYGDRRPRGRGLHWLVALIAAFYAACLVATLLAGANYALAALGAALIPLTAAALVVATAGRKTKDHATGDDPFPGIGPDEATALGDTDQHSDAAA
jgi:peptidoglycan/LPS O-acetylase OafA/YrhL